MKQTKVVALGVDAFDKALADTNTTNVHLNWQPPARGDTALIELLFRLET